MADTHGGAVQGLRGSAPCVWQRQGAARDTHHHRHDSRQETACGECFLLGVIEQQVLHAEFGGELAGVERRAVRLLVGLELLAVGVEAESLAE